MDHSFIFTYWKQNNRKGKHEYWPNIIWYCTIEFWNSPINFTTILQALQMIIYTYKKHPMSYPYSKPTGCLTLKMFLQIFFFFFLIIDNIPVEVLAQVSLWLSFWNSSSTVLEVNLCKIINTGQYFRHIILSPPPTPTPPITTLTGPFFLEWYVIELAVV